MSAQRAKGARGAPVSRGTGAHPAVVRRAAAALLDWWRLSGHDAWVPRRPTPWQRAAAPPRPAATGRAASATATRPAAPPAAAEGPEPLPATAEPGAARPAAATRPAAPSAETFGRASSLDALAAAVRAAFPAAVFADGNPASGAMLMGESPSAEDLRTGRPFSGPAGQLLDRMLAAIGRSRASAYLALLVCRQDVAGPPTEEAVAQDLPIARAHVRLAAPRALLLLGATPARALLGADEPISRLRGRWFELALDDGSRVPALPTYNPAYLLRRPEAKREAWADLLAFAERLAG